MHRQTAQAFLGRAPNDGRQYDLVFVDPPYRRASGLGESLTTAIAPVLTPNSRVVAESDRRAPLELDLPLVDQRRYGDTLIFFYGHQITAPQSVPARSTRSRTATST